MYDSSGCTGPAVIVLLALVVGVLVWGWATGLITDNNNSEAKRISAEASRLEARASVIQANTEKGAQQERDNRAQFALYSVTLATITHDPLLWIIMGLVVITLVFVFLVGGRMYMQ